MFCKILNLVPRHELIVSRILGKSYSHTVTKTIGALEILMFIWVISRIQSRWCAITQIIIVVAMNITEFILVPDILLFGRANIIVALFFISIVFFNEFILTNQVAQK
ncbi:MAG TPA: DoxX-like family protein [Bacteroidia bacterium]|nr:DoxX-like family protein [Bacteroidia bacterium]